MRRLPFMRRPPVILPLKLADTESLQILHGQAFAHGWGAEAFRSFLDDNQVIGFGAYVKNHRPFSIKRELRGFILARLVCGEAEILTFTIDKSARRGGLGRALLEHLLRHLYSERAEALFLEVDEHNAPALSLYKSLGFAETGRRKAYYDAASQVISENGEPHEANARSDAVLLEYRFKPKSPII